MPRPEAVSAIARANPDGGHRAVLADLAGRDRLRRLEQRAGIDFTSNDFLALAESDELRQALAEALEAEAAHFFGSEAALYYPTGFAANAALSATLPRTGDLVVHDALIHASFRDGLASGRVETCNSPHGDVSAIDDAITNWRRRGGTGTAWIAVESLYSMDGDRADLDALIAIADRHEAFLIIDEAHASGVYGPSGRGLGAHLEGRGNVISLHTCGKAMGTMGALVCLPRHLRDFMVNRSRGFIYSTAPSPLMAAGVRAALGIVARADERRQALQQLVAHAGALLGERLGIAITGSQIQPVIVGQDAAAMRLAAGLRQRGYDVRAIRPPTVPEGTARLRLALTLHLSVPILDGFVADLADEMTATGVTAHG